jgi:hypothetical protein
MNQVGLPAPSTVWTDRVAFELALLLEGSGESLTDLTQRNNLSTADIVRYRKDTAFLQKLKAFREEIRDKGLTFKLKARVQAEELLKTSWALIHSATVLPSVKADVIKATVKWAGLEPTGKDGEQSQSQGVAITINLGGQELQTKIIDVTPISSSPSPDAIQE